MEATSTKLMIQLEDKAEIERLISLISLGICAALKKGIVNLEAAESYLYSPYTIEQLKSLEVDQELIDLIHLGTELEDVESLIPEKLSDSICEIEVGTLKFLQSLCSGSSNDRSRKKWIQI
ncbi:MAG: DUF3969 family protein [Xenococcaceae cyanobacterium]